MQRHNLFALTNKGLRNEMYQTAASLQYTDLTTAESTPVIHQLELLLNEWRRISDRNGAHTHPFIKNRGLATLMERNRRVGFRLCDELTDCATRWRAATGMPTYQIIATKLLYDFNEFVAFNLYYMNKQENELMTILWQNHTDEEIQNIAAGMIRSLTNDELIRESRYVIAAVNDDELCEWLTVLKINIPLQRLAGVIDMAKNVLPASRIDRLSTTCKGVCLSLAECGSAAAEVKFASK